MTPAAGFLVLVLTALAVKGEGLSLAAALGILVVFVGLGVMSPQHLIYLIAVWLAVLGVARRLMGGELLPGSADPLLLIGPAGLILLVIFADRNQYKGERSWLANAVLLLQGLAVLSVLNPLQGNPAVALAGMLFVPVPMLAFWAGRFLCDDRTMSRVLKIVAALSIPAALYGHYQTNYGFPSWDARWISEAGYASLDVLGITRPFSSFSSATDYLAFVAIGLVAWTAFGVRRKPLIGLPAVALLSLVLIYGSQRKIVVTVLFAVALVTAAWFKWSLSRAFSFGVVLLFALPLTLTYFAPRLEGIKKESPLLEHQIDGLADPLNKKSSTLDRHFSMVTNGFRSLSSYPLGRGIGAVTIAGLRFGNDADGDAVAGTEADPSNAAVALGLPGLVAYLIVVVTAFRRAYSVAVARGDPLSYAVLGVLAVMVLQWLNGGQYAVVWLTWLALGWVDRTHESAQPTTVVQHAASPLESTASPVAAMHSRITL